MTDRDQSLTVLTVPNLNLPSSICRIYPRYPESDVDLISSDKADCNAYKSNWTFVCYCRDDGSSDRQGSGNLNRVNALPIRNSCLIRAGITAPIFDKQNENGSKIVESVWCDTSKILELSSLSTPRSEKYREQVAIIDVAWRRDGCYGAILTRRAVFLVDHALHIVTRWIQPLDDELQSIIWAGLGVLVSTVSHVWVLGLDGATALVASLFPWGTGCRLCAVNSDMLVYLTGPGGPGSRPTPVVRSLGLVEPLMHGILSQSNFVQDTFSTRYSTRDALSQEKQKSSDGFASLKDRFLTAEVQLEATNLESSLVEAVSRGNCNKVSMGLLGRVAASGPQLISFLDRVWGVGGSGLGWLSWKGQYNVAWSSQNWRACLVLLLNRPPPPEGPISTKQHFYRLAIAAYAAQDLATAAAAMWAAGEDQALVQLIAESCDVLEGLVTSSGKSTPSMGTSAMQSAEIARTVTKFLASYLSNPSIQITFKSLQWIPYGKAALPAWQCSVPARAQYLSQDLLRRGFKASTLPPMMFSEQLENLDRFARSDDLSEWIGAATSLAREASAGNTASPAASSHGSESRGSHSVASRAGSREGSTSASYELGRVGKVQRTAIGPGGTGSLWSADSTSAASRADSVQGAGGDGAAGGWLSGNGREFVGEGGERGSGTENSSRGVDDDDDDWGDGGREVEAKTKIQLVSLYVLG